MLDLLLPQRCLACGRSGAAVCEACLESLPWIEPPLCERCGSPTAWPVRRCAECSGRRVSFETARAAVAYDERVRAIVAGWKEHGLRRMAATAADLVTAAIPRPPVEALTYVPADRTRLLERGHHPAERLARELGEALGAARPRLTRAHAVGAAPARREPRGPAPQCPRRVHGQGRALAGLDLSRGRRLHLRRDRLRVRHRAPKGRRPPRAVVTFARALRLR